MKEVFIIRNASYEQNATMNRLVVALGEISKVTVVSRERLSGKNYDFIIDSTRNIEFNHLIININAQYGKGLINIFSLIKYQFSILKVLYINRKKIDLIHSVDLDSGIVTKIFSRLYKKKYIYHIADFYTDSRKGIPRLFKDIIRKIEFSVINNAETTILCTSNREEQIIGSYPRKIEIIHNVPFLERDFMDKKDKSNSKNTKINICYIGTLSSNRFIKELIETVINLEESVSLTIGGYGPLKNYVNELSAKHENINYIGKVSYLDSFKYYESCDIMIAVYDPTINNHIYSAPNKVYEAILLRKPIIVAENTGIDDIVKEHEIGYIIDYRIEQLENLLKEIISDPSVLDRKVENTDKAYKIFNWKDVKLKIQKVYTSIG